MVRGEAAVPLPLASRVVPRRTARGVFVAARQSTSVDLAVRPLRNAEGRVAVVRWLGQSVLGMPRMSQPARGPGAPRERLLRRRNLVSLVRL